MVSVIVNLTAKCNVCNGKCGFSILKKIKNKKNKSESENQKSVKATKQ